MNELPRNFCQNFTHRNTPSETCFLNYGVPGIAPPPLNSTKRSMSDEKTIRSWSEMVAGLGVDMLVDHGLIDRADFERAKTIVAEEIFVRLALGDYPPLAE